MLHSSSWISVKMGYRYEECNCKDIKMENIGYRVKYFTTIFPNQRHFMPDPPSG